MGSDRALVAGAGSHVRTVTRAPPGDQRNLVETADRGALAGSAGTLRAVEDLSRTAAPVDRRRDLGQILAAAQVYDDGQPVEWVISVDCSVVRAHQHAAGAHKKGDLSAASPWGRAGDKPQLFPLLDAIAVHDGGPGRPRKKPDMLIAGKACAHDRTRRGLRKRGIAQHHRRTRRPDRPPRRERQRGRPNNGLRRRDLPAEKRRGTLLQPVQTMACACHSLCRTSSHLPGITAAHRRSDLAPMIGRTRPKRGGKCAAPGSGSPGPRA